jgi:hypothetical protein
MWLTPLAHNPFDTALERVRPAPPPNAPPPAAPPAPADTSKGAKKEGKKEKSGGAGKGGSERATTPTADPDADAREAEKMASYARQFERMQQAEERRAAARQRRAEREEADPCKCGYARTRRLPKPLAPGGPRCPHCTPLLAPSADGDDDGGGAEHGTKRAKTEGGPRLEMREAPCFYPSEEEFVDPMAYIRSVQHLAHPVRRHALGRTPSSAPRPCTPPWTHP